MNELKSIKGKSNQNLYYVAYGLFLFGYVVVGCTNLLNGRISNMIYQVIRIFTVASMLYLTALNFVYVRKDKKYCIQKFLVLSALSVILLLHNQQSGVNGFLTWFLLTVPAEGKPVKKIVDTAWNTLLIAVSVVVVLFAVGVIQDHFIEGMSLGFYHPNAVGAWCTAILCLWMIRRYEKLCWYDFLGMTLLTLLIYYLTGCRTILVSTAFMFALVGLFKLGEKKVPFEHCAKWVVRLLLPTCIVMSLGIGYFYDPESAVMALLNKVLSGRFWLAHRFMEEYSPTLFGQPVSLGLPLDNVYVLILLESGVAVFTLVLGAWYIAMNRLFTKKEYALVIACCVYVLYGISESYVELVEYNFTLLLIAQLFPQKGEGARPVQTDTKQ